ncbi:SGS-domain-containing protein [Basidiobolus meristosporus CBS 931.73]|uniref:SGS-domain-containing protein n=1 Tax=Basidiobolus meristosporus CBS 931.73 TaxID=1314790 RepID=A0A1Y1Y2H2_9FUNG|nr:SGS-domain-containing protein [Basidiobolus meristosporus CBS 931.73]|eukprot:ORX92211.1 SGS-domain-containing protein [Basidiobolus meristosporus CBS 931.73]
MSVAAELYKQAVDSYFEDDYGSAFEKLSEALSEEPENPEYYLKRSIVGSKLKKFENSLEDSIKAIALLEEKKVENKTLSRAYLRKGLTFYNLERFVRAKETFEKVRSLNPEEKDLDLWWKKCVDKCPKEAESLKKVEPSSSQPAPPVDKLQPPGSSKIKTEWYQNHDFITITLFIKNAKQNDVTVEFEQRGVSISVKTSAGSDVNYDWEPLSHPIIPEESKYLVLSTKIELRLKKAHSGVQWGVLEGTDTLAGHFSNQASKPNYPSSARNARNWDKLEKELQNDDDKLEGDQALNSMFQKLYKDAGEDVRKAMVKSFVESGGTCLSTNWEEVSKNKVEVRPPEGMEPKKY